MKKYVLTGLFLCSIMSVVICGCNTPQQKLYVATQSYNTLATVATNLRTEGLIPDDIWVRIKETDSVAWAALQMYRLSIEGGHADQTQLDAFNEAIDVISKEIKKVISATSQPVN